ncbi:hypothetical protein [Halorubrum sp. Ea8]|nr:hypothetical protein [Halorubrum sp. Ea8]
MIGVIEGMALMTAGVVVVNINPLGPTVIPTFISGDQLGWLTE